MVAAVGSGLQPGAISVMTICFRERVIRPFSSREFRATVTFALQASATETRKGEEPRRLSVELEPQEYDAYQQSAGWMAKSLAFPGHRNAGLHARSRRSEKGRA
jgi:hypothetical protein